MADRLAATIVIGGTLPRRYVREFLDHIRDDALHLTEDEDQPITSAEHLLAGLTAAGHLSLTNYAAAYGQFEELEAFCREQGVPYDRYHDANYEMAASWTIWRRGMTEPRYYLSCGDMETVAPKHVCVELEELLRQIAQSETLAAAQVLAKTAVQRLVLATELLELPTFTIGE